MIQKRTSAVREWKASEIRKLPPEQRDAILAAAALQAEHEYRTNKSLTDFETFGEDDLYGTSTATSEG